MSRKHMTRSKIFNAMNVITLLRKMTILNLWSGDVLPWHVEQDTNFWYKFLFFAPWKPYGFTLWWMCPARLGKGVPPTLRRTWKGGKVDGVDVPQLLFCKCVVCDNSFTTTQFYFLKINEEHSPPHLSNFFVFCNFGYFFCSLCLFFCKVKTFMVSPSIKTGRPWWGAVFTAWKWPGGLSALKQKCHHLFLYLRKKGKDRYLNIL